MRTLAALFLFATLVALPDRAALAIEKGVFAIVDIAVLGEEAEIEALRQTPLVGDLVRQFEAAGSDGYAAYDPETALLKTFAPDRESALRLDEATGSVFDGDAAIGALTTATVDEIVVRIAELPDFLPFELQIRFERRRPETRASSPRWRPSTAARRRRKRSAAQWRRGRRPRRRPASERRFPARP